MRTLKLLSIGVFLVSVMACQGVSQTPNPKYQASPAGNGESIKLRLNREDAGTTGDTKTLTDLLAKIFRQREDEGILRPGTNSIETSVILGADRTVRSEVFAGVFGTLSGARAAPILVPVPATRNIRPNPLLLYVHAGVGEIPLVSNGLAIGLIGELFENRFGGGTTIAITTNKDGTFLLGDKQLTAAALKTELVSRIKTAAKDKKVVFLRADNFGNIEDVASMAAAAGAMKLYIVTANRQHKEEGISFSLSPSFTNDTEAEQVEGLRTIRYRRPEYWSFEFTLQEELVEKGAIDAEIASEFDFRKKNFPEAEVSMFEISGSGGILTVRKDNGFSGNWMGTRSMNGKRQIVTISFSCSATVSPDCAEQSAFSENEFRAVMNSIKFE